MGDDYHVAKRDFVTSEHLKYQQWVKASLMRNSLTIEAAGRLEMFILYLIHNQEKVTHFFILASYAAGLKDQAYIV